MQPLSQRVALGVQIFAGLLGTLVGLWWCGMANMITNGTQGPEAEAVVREVQMKGLAVIMPIALLPILLVRYLAQREAR